MAKGIDTIRAEIARRLGARQAFVVAGDACSALGKSGLVGAGDLLVVAADDDRRASSELAARLGVALAFAEPTACSLSAVTATRRASADAPYERVVWVVPSLGGISLEVADIGSIGEAARTSGAVLAIDNTVVTMGGCAACHRGADVVLESLGHLGLTAVALSARTLALRPLDEPPQVAPSAVPGLAAYLEALPRLVRLRCDAASVMASYLACHPRVSWVSYPGLASSASHAEAASRIEHGFGPVVHFSIVPDTIDAVGAFMGDSAALGSSLRGSDDESRIVPRGLSGPSAAGLFRRNYFSYVAGIGDVREDVAQVERAIARASW
jgi:O-acetylhomoserine/O-acetylserine sulfhydrylase-like pyridoxal-dependent enzyme